MTKSATINSRIEPGLKAEAEAVFATLGLSPSEALTLFYTQVSLYQGLPFDIRIPNAETVAAMRELQEGKGHRYDSLQDALDDIDDA